MNRTKLIIVSVVIVIAAILVWRMFPGLRTKVGETYDAYGGWTEAARERDPVGFLTFAEQTLNDHLKQLTDARGSLQTAMRRIESETQRNRALIGSADSLAVQFRNVFKAAKTYPVAVSGASYGREELIEQVRLVLLQRTNYQNAIDDLAAAAQAAKAAGQNILTQLTDTQAALASLPAKKEIARVNELTGKTQELLGQIDALMVRNESVLSEAPVRTVEELTAGAAAELPESASVDVMAFLEGE